MNYQEKIRLFVLSMAIKTGKTGFNLALSVINVGYFNVRDRGIWHFHFHFFSLFVQVSHSLDRLESVNNFTEFVKAFSQFGAEMVELAHLTGDRQNDLKDERRRAQMAAARQVLERSTMMLLTSSKVSVPTCDYDPKYESNICHCIPFYVL